MGLSNVEGTFNTYDGGFQYEEKTNKLSKIEVVIKTKSIDTDNNKRDQHLRKGDFFNVTRFPQINFKSTKVVYERNRPVKAIGTLTIRDITKVVTLDLKIKGIVKDPWDKEKKSLFLAAKTTLKRSDYGITWNKVIDNGEFILSDDVFIDLEIEAFQAGVRPAFSRFYLPTTDIKKSVKEEIVQVDKTTKKIAPTKRVVTSSIVKETNSTKGMFYTLFFGFFLFLVMIVGAIQLQLWMTKKLEKLKFNDTLTFVIPTFIIIVILTTVAIGFAPYMGYGTHPWQ